MGAWFKKGGVNFGGGLHTEGVDKGVGYIK